MIIFPCNQQHSGLQKKMKLDTVGGNIPKPNEICCIIIISFFHFKLLSQKYLMAVMALKELTGLTNYAEVPQPFPGPSPYTIHGDISPRSSRRARLLTMLPCLDIFPTHPGQIVHCPIAMLATSVLFPALFSPTRPDSDPHLQDDISSQA